MSAEMFFWASLQFANDEAIKTVERELEEEGCVGHDDNLLDADAFERDGLEVRCYWDGSAPSSCFEVSAGVLETYARHAKSGEAIALELEACWGYRYPGGYDVEDEDFDDELTEEEIEDLYEERRRGA